MEPIAGGSSAKSNSIGRMQLVDWLKDCSSKVAKEQYDYLAKKVIALMHADDLSEESCARLNDFVKKYRTRWTAASRNRPVFQNKNSDWLGAELQFLSNSKVRKTVVAQGQRGRPAAEFLSSSERSKRRKTAQFRLDRSPEELVYAAQMQYRLEGKLDAAEVIKKVAFSSPARASRYKKAIQKKSEIPLSANEALSLFVEAKLTKFQYNYFIRNSAKCHKSCLYPNYETITAAKKQCYPDNLKISEGIAEVPLQNLLDHTTLRICESIKEVFDTLRSKNCNNLYLISKWGCDGSSGMSQYKQLFSVCNVSDANMFFTSMVPIQLINGDPNSKEKFVIWQDPRTFSSRFCRPIRIQLKHETTELSVAEKVYIENQISILEPTRLSISLGNVAIHHALYFTMIDGKLCNAITKNSSSQRCYICGLTAKDFNNVDKCLKQCVLDESRYQFGLSSLHAWIRFFECMLHVVYKIVTKQWQARGKDNQELVAKNKKRIQDAFLKEMGLLLDRPKPGFGSTNDGNTSRRFFEDPEKSSKITGVDVELISRFKTVLLTISSGYHIKINSFKSYCENTARLFAELYAWYNMPISVHKILIHSSEIISYFMIPIGQLGEEAQESRNKDIKRYRTYHSRKFSRKQNMEDVINNPLVSSDPLISSMTRLSARKLKHFPKEVLNFFDELLIEKNIEGDNDSDSFNDDEDVHG